MLDAHQHFWTVARGDYAWMSPDLVPLYRDFGPQDLAPLMQAAGITRTILVQAAETEAETEFLLDLAARTDFVAGVVGWLDMTAPDFAARLAHFKAQPKFAGLRPMLQEHDPQAIRDPRFHAALREVAAQDVPFDILTHPRHLAPVVEAIAQAPGLHAILDHISKPVMTGPIDPEWVAGIQALARVPGLNCKVSGMVTEAGEDWSLARIQPFFDVIADAFGPARLVFGTDWPVCTLAASHAEVVALAKALFASRYDADDIAAIMETNGARFYRL